MLASVRNSLLAVLVALSAAASANPGFYLPSAPTGAGGEDVVETASGSRCRQSINSNGAYLDVGVAASRSTNARDVTNDVRHVQSSDGLGYARVTVPLGKRPRRLDCARLYEMEIQRMQREIELLTMAAE